MDEELDDIGDPGPARRPQQWRVRNHQNRNLNRNDWRIRNEDRQEPVAPPPARGRHPRGQGRLQTNQRRPNQRNPNNQMNGHQENGNNVPRRYNNRQNHSQFLNFKALEEIAQSDSKEIIVKINDRKEAFLNLLESPFFDNDKWDIYVLIMKLVAKVCQSSFDQLKLTMLLEICNSRFIASLRSYLMELPYLEVKARHRFYWNNQQEFWDNFTTFCECIVDLSPSTALHKCRSLIDSASKCCLELLQERHGFILQNECSVKITQLRERLTYCEKEEKVEKQKPKNFNSSVADEPPDDFRQLNVVPSSEDLMDRRPFVRPNIVSGSYLDTEHYLDVQFRLLREDCFGPLRDGIHQFIQNPNGKKFDNIRVYRNVKFVEPYISKTKTGVTIQFDETTMKRFKKINWAHSKRFIFGSLLLLTKDNCKSIITATILDRDVKMLANGKIPISLVDMQKENLYKDESYIMIESEVYFEPYLHVLKALQDPKFAEHLAMSQYIIKVDPQPKSPAYLNPDSIFGVEIPHLGRTKFRVLQESTWPTDTELGLNQSQYEAYKLALTHEFAVIQGPPGTGKTYLGVKVAKTLIENLSTEIESCLMLVICYTNHALDQFLEAILPVTKSIVRIGGQSKNEAMEKINLNNLRRNKKDCFAVNKMFFEQRDALRYAIAKLNTAQQSLDSLNHGIISYNYIRTHIPESEFLQRYYTNHKSNIKSDPLRHWLFENMTYIGFQNILLEEHGTQNNEMAQNEEEDNFARTEFILDQFDDDQDFEIISEQKIDMSFSLKDTERRLQSLLLLYSKTNKRRVQQELQDEIVDLKSRIELFKEMNTNRTRGIGPQVNDRTNFNRVSIQDRWLIYFRWAATIINDMREHILPLQREVDVANTAYEEARMMIDLRILRGIKVVGMTTSGAARLRKLLQALAPPIVIVEEAAEVLEQHIVTSLTKDCEHLILIGDHQQLRPSAAHMKLARHFNLEISLFERMITNGIHSRRLAVQHRMRPEIASLISPHIYPDLINHPSVEQFPKVKGMTDNLFFMTHDYKEEEVEEGSSRSNKNEADLALGLANYLMQQGYQTEDVTVLAGYSGQMFYMRNQREKYPHLAKIKITVVDNYQGEESKIIILSLVRNNNNNKIGFLGTDNRVCVALSRAREGFFILGNIHILKNNSALWQKIATTLQNSALLGTNLMLKCENHPGQITCISSPKDFEKVPEGGCLLKCNFNLPCHHPCALICHGYDRDHTSIKCYRRCERILCELGHECPQLCLEKCKPCKRLVEKVFPKCGHKMMIFCYLDVTDPTVKCNYTLRVTLPKCGHDEVKKPCYLSIDMVKCPRRCEFRVDKCGHECIRNCHVDDDPHHEKYLCQKACAKAKKGCTANLIGDRGDHQCQKQCYENCDNCTVEVSKKRSNCKHSERVPCDKNVDEIPCRKNCARVLDCGHFCKKKCYEKCGDCKQKVKKIIPDCNHEVEVLCMKEATRDLCKRYCERILPCGHPCKAPCNVICSQSKCTYLIPQKIPSSCGHRVLLPCYAYAEKTPGASFGPKFVQQFCTEPCTKLLQCGHQCSGTCSKCRQGRVHVPCTQTCHQTNICGHQCKEPCNQMCPPCKIGCEIKCRHTRCNKLCGALCTPCEEPCTRQCPHGACSRRCGEPCSRRPCDERCPKFLRCGHRCRGLCGEPCPNICNICRPEDFPKGLMGEDYEDDEILIKLEDCSHFLEVETMDTLMMGDKETIGIRACPFCRHAIVNTHRYKDVVNNMFRTEINPVKQKVYGTEMDRKRQKEELLVKINTWFSEEHYQTICQENKYISLAFEALRRALILQKNESLLVLEMQFQYLNILNMTAERYQNYKKIKTSELKEELLDTIKIICNALKNNIKKISQQLQMDINNELKRMNSIVQLSKILSHSTYFNLKSASKIINATVTTKNIVLSSGVYDQKEALKALNELQNAVNIFGIVSKEERDLIVKAIGSKAGSWYKCPNGHFYSIAQCGGAMEISRCADCGVPIGGTSHTLLATNSHAGELDGSPHAAWSNNYNNMANFLLD